MTANTPSDYETKLGLLEDVYVILDIEKILTGNEEQIGGFDLMCKGEATKFGKTSVYTSRLGCYNNRNQ